MYLPEQVPFLTCSFGWIGVYKSEDEIWQWVDDTVCTWTNWDTEQPWTEDVYAHITNDKWFGADKMYTSLTYALCERGNQLLKRADWL